MYILHVHLGMHNWKSREREMGQEGMGTGTGAGTGTGTTQQHNPKWALFVKRMHNYYPKHLLLAIKLRQACIMDGAATETNYSPTVVPAGSASTVNLEEFCVAYRQFFNTSELLLTKRLAGALGSPEAHEEITRS